MQHIVSKLGLSGHGTVGGIGGANPSSSCCGVMLAGKSNCNTTQAVSRASKAKEKHRAYMYQHMSLSPNSSTSAAASKT